MAAYEYTSKRRRLNEAEEDDRKNLNELTGVKNTAGQSVRNSSFQSNVSIHFTFRTESKNISQNETIFLLCSNR